MLGAFFITRFNRGWTGVLDDKPGVPDQDGVGVVKPAQMFFPQHWILTETALHSELSQTHRKNKHLFFYPKSSAYKSESGDNHQVNPILLPDRGFQRMIGMSARGWSSYLVVLLFSSDSWRQRSYHCSVALNHHSVRRCHGNPETLSPAARSRGSWWGSV